MYKYIQFIWVKLAIMVNNTMVVISYCRIQVLYLDPKSCKEGMSREKPRKTLWSTGKITENHICSHEYILYKIEKLSIFEKE